MEEVERGRTTRKRTGVRKGGGYAEVAGDTVADAVVAAAVADGQGVPCSHWVLAAAGDEVRDYRDYLYRDDRDSRGYCGHHHDYRDYLPAAAAAVHDTREIDQRHPPALAFPLSSASILPAWA